jgi:transposase
MKTKTTKMIKTKTAVATRRRYSDDYVANALLRADQHGVAVTARQLGVAESMLYAWRAKAKSDASLSDQERANRDELGRLRKQVAELATENDFLKKAAAYFAKQPK